MRKINRGWTKRSSVLLIGGLVGSFLLGGCTTLTGTTSKSGVLNTDVATINEAKKKFQPLPPLPVPADNKMTSDKVSLGQTLFNDPRLSGNNTVSCLSCHNPQLGFSNGTAVSPGIHQRVGTRNSLSVMNAGFYTSFFWDGRAKTLEEQALGPIQNPVEMDQNLDALIIKLNGIDRYEEGFKKVFNQKVTKDNLAKALAAYERTIVMDKTPFDNYLAGNDKAISDEAKQGMVLFAGKAGCIQCHGGATLSDNQFHNIGMEGNDPGRYNVTKKEEDWGKFRTSQLRGLMYTGPFMHNGKMNTLSEVVSYYNRGGDNGKNKDEKIKPLNLSASEQKALVSFLQSLSTPTNKK